MNIAGTAIHSCLGIERVTKLLDLNAKSKASSRNSSSEVNFSFVDELSMTSRDLWAGTGLRLGEMFMIIPEKTFAGLSFMIVANMLQ